MHFLVQPRVSSSILGFNLQQTRVFFFHFFHSWKKRKIALRRFSSKILEKAKTCVMMRFPRTSSRKWLKLPEQQSLLTAVIQIHATQFHIFILIMKIFNLSTTVAEAFVYQIVCWFFHTRFTKSLLQHFYQGRQVYLILYTEFNGSSLYELFERDFFVRVVQVLI